VGAELGWHDETALVVKGVVVRPDEWHGQISPSLHNAPLYGDLTHIASQRAHSSPIGGRLKGIRVIAQGAPGAERQTSENRT